MIDAFEKYRQFASAIGGHYEELMQELVARTIAAEFDALEQARLSGMGASREAALMAKLEAAEKECDNYKVAYNEWIEKTEWVQRGINDGTIPPKYLGWHRVDVVADLLSAAEKERDDVAMQLAQSEQGKRKISEECDALLDRIEAMEQQEPFDADSAVFRSAFEAALKAGNWPTTRQGDGYRSPSTQIAWRIAFSTVNRLTLYLAPGAKGE